MTATIFAPRLQAQDAGDNKEQDRQPVSNTKAESIDDIFRSVFGKERPAIGENDYNTLIEGVNMGAYRIAPDDRDEEGWVEADFVANVLAGAITEEASVKIRQLTNGRDKIPFRMLRQMGLEVTFDKAQLVLRIGIPLEIRAVRDLNIRSRRGRGNVEFAKEADIAASASFRAGITIVEDSAIIDKTFNRFAADIDLALNIKGAVLTADLRYDSIRNRKFTRGDVRLSYDDRSRLIRYELGDLTVARRPFQNAPRIAGISAARNYAINPYLNIRPTSQQSFELERPARVQVLLNGSPVRSFDLPSGRYNLRDLPLVASAGNDIELQINYGSGQVETLSFPAFYDLELLAPGLLDFAVNVGLPFRDDNGIRRYDDSDYNGTAYARYGISPTLTTGVNWEGSRDFDLLGGEIVWASPIGTFAVNASTNIRKAGIDDSKLTMQYRWRDTDPSRERAIDGLLSLTGKDYRTLNEIFSGAFTAVEAKVRASQKFGPRTRAQISAGYENFRIADGDSYYIGFNVSRQFRFGSIYAGAEYRKSPERSGPAVRFGLSIPLGRSSLTASYMSEDNAARIEYNRLGSVGVDSWNFGAGADRRNGADRQFARAAYLGNRFEAGVQQIARNYFSNNSRRDLRTEVTFGSALVMADGQFAISRPVRNNFAIFKVNEKAGDYNIAVEPRTGFGSSETRYSGYSGALGPAVITSLTPYFNRSVQVDAPDAPAGTSVGGQVFELSPGLRSGYSLTVGTAANVSVVGNMVDKDGDPLVYISGNAILQDGGKNANEKMLAKMPSRYSPTPRAASSWKVLRLAGLTGSLSIWVTGKLSTIWKSQRIRPDYIVLEIMYFLTWMFQPKGVKKMNRFSGFRGIISGTFLMCGSVYSGAAMAQNDVLDTGTGPCEMHLNAENSVDWRGSYGRGYEVFDNSPSYESFTISVSKEGGPCDFFLTASPIGAPAAGQLTGPEGSLTYDILKTTNGPSFLNADFLGSQLSRIEGRFGSGSGAYSGALFVTVPTGQFVRGGTYSGQALIRLFRDDLNGPELIAETPVAILAPVASVLRVRSDSFGNGNRETSIDFGDLSLPSSHNIDFEITSNADIAVSFQSANSGKMAHEFGGPSIGYDITLRGEEIDLSQQVATRRLNYRGDDQSQSMPVEISVIPPGGIPPAGRYSDTLMVTFTAD
ncbi:MAG: fimbria/pilus outer membrane usher protein [Sphingomonadales bacterium]|nr:fimbria/pilus outer membrane usher protein [Sphingomonadales bacterium]